MKILNKKILSLSALPVLFLIAWLIALFLTQQRILLESVSKIQAIENNQTSFVWNFELFENDVITPYQKYWQVLEDSSVIYAAKESKPVLSLNFSGETLNATHFDKIELVSPKTIEGMLKLQIKTSHSDDVFYYSDPIKLSGANHSLSLNRDWYVIKKGNQAQKFKWSGIHNSISSLVFQFYQLKNDLYINEIRLPIVHATRKTVKFNIDCQGKIGNDFIIDPKNHNIFTLNESCWLPSNYMWLKSHLNEKYPGSILSIKGKRLFLNASNYKINTNYANNPQIYLALYIFIFLLFLLVYVITNNHAKRSDRSSLLIDKNWVKAYAIILGTSFIAFILMALVKTPNLAIFHILPMYFIWAIIQQIFLGWVLAEKCFFKVTQNKFISSVLAASVFAILHLPSITLSVLTLIAGFLWSYAWLSYKRIVPLAISHAVLALMIYDTLSSKILYSARVFHWFWE